MEKTEDMQKEVTIKISHLKDYAYKTFYKDLEGGFLPISQKSFKSTGL